MKMYCLSGYDLEGFGATVYHSTKASAFEEARKVSEETDDEVDVFSFSMGNTKTDIINGLNGVQFQSNRVQVASFTDGKKVQQERSQ